MKKFWNWKNRTVTNEETQEQIQERTLFLNGTIAEESWFDDDVTPQLFKDELMSGSGNITVWINSPGGDCVAAAQIYNMLMDYHGDVTVKIDGIAASAAWKDRSRAESWTPEMKEKARQRALQARRKKE